MKARNVHRSSHSKRKFPLFLAALVAIVVLLTIFRHAILLGCAKVALRHWTEEGRIVSYDSMVEKGGRIEILGLRVEEDAFQVAVDCIEIDLQWKSWPWAFTPHVRVVHPEVIFNRSDEKGMKGAWLPIGLLPTKRLAVRWEVQNGVLQIAGQRYYFNFAGKDKNIERIAIPSIGTLSFYYDPQEIDPPFFYLDLYQEENSLACQFRLEEVDGSRLAPLAGLAFSQFTEGWNGVQGDIVWEGRALIDASLYLQKLESRFTGKQIFLDNTVAGLQIKLPLCEAEILYPDNGGEPLWDNIRASLVINGGECRLNSSLAEEESVLQEIQADLQVDPQHPPEFHVQATFKGKQNSFPIELKGKGSKSSDGAFWLETSLNILPGGKSNLQMVSSLCHSLDEQYVFQLEWSNLGYQHLELLNLFTDFSQTLPWQWVDGKSDGKATLWFDRAGPKRLAVENLQADQMRLYSEEKGITAFAKDWCGEGDVLWDGNKGWHIEQFQAELEGGEVVVSGAEPIHCSDLAGRLNFAKGSWQGSNLQGNIGDLQAKALWNIPGQESDVDIEMQGPLSSLLQLATGEAVHFATENVPLARLKASWKQEGEGGELTGEIESLEETFRFGCELGKVELVSSIAEIREGWFRCERVTPQLYSPLVKAALPGIGLTGEIDLFGTFDAKKVHLSMQGQEICFDHPLFALKAAKIGERDPQLINTEGRAVFQYDKTAGGWKGTIPLQAAQFEQKEAKILFENVDTVLHFDENTLWTDLFQTNCAGIEIEGEFTLTTMDKETVEWTLETHRMAGDVKNLSMLAGRYPQLGSFHFPANGKMSSGAKEVYYHSLTKGQVTQTDWSAKVSFSDLSIPLSEKSRIEQGQCTISFDSEKGVLGVEKAHGKLQLANGAVYQLQADKFSFQDDQEKLLQFDLKLFDAQNELIHLVGAAKQLGSGAWQCLFDSKATHFFDRRLQVQKLTLMDFTDIQTLEMAPKLKCQDLIKQLTFLADCGLIPSSKEIIKALNDLQPQGTLLSQVSFDKGQLAWIFSLESSDLKLSGKPLSQFLLKGKCKGGQWFIEKLQADELLFKTTISPQRLGYNLTALEAKWRDLSVKGSALIATEQNMVHCNIESFSGDLAKLYSQAFSKTELQGSYVSSGQLKIQLPAADVLFSMQGELSLKIETSSSLPIIAENQQKITAFYSPQQGVRLKGIDLLVRPKSGLKNFAQLSVQEISYQINTRQWDLKRIFTRLSQESLNALADAKLIPGALKEIKFDDALQGSFDAAFGPNVFSMQGMLNDGSYGLGESRWQLSQIGVLFDMKSFCLRCRTNLSQLPVIAQLQVDLAPEPYGMLKIQESSQTEGVKALFRTSSGKIIWDSIKGNLSGLTLQLAKSDKTAPPNTSLLSGSINMDLQKMRPLFSEELRKTLDKVKAGHGFELQGDLLVAKENIGFEGKLLGREFEILGYRLKNLESLIKIGSQNVQLANVKIEDPCGIATAKQIKLRRLENEGKWDVEIPLIYVRDFSPSALRNLNKPATPLKPLLIKNLSISNIKGAIGRHIELEGKGTFYFTNAFKKGSSLFEAPLEMLKNLGLDPGLFTPVQGEVDLELHGDKFYVTELKNVFSEGGRSEFYLAPEPEGSYVDLEGNVRVDLKMRQNVVLKLTEPLTLTIRGTLEKPRYSFQ